MVCAQGRSITSPRHETAADIAAVELTRSLEENNAHRNELGIRPHHPEERSPCPGGGGGFGVDRRFGVGRDGTLGECHQRGHVRNPHGLRQGGRPEQRAEVLGQRGDGGRQRARLCSGNNVVTWTYHWSMGNSTLTQGRNTCTSFSNITVLQVKIA